MRYLALSILVLLPGVALAGDNIAFGLVKGIKVYHFATTKETRIAFESSATHQSIPGCNLEAKLVHSQHDDATLNRLLGLALTAYTSGRKLRAYSSNDDCNADFLALQETYF